MKRKCKGCNKVKPLTEFHRRGNGLFRAKCKPCFKVDAVAYRANQSEEAKANARSRYHVNSEAIRTARIEKYHSDPKAKAKVLTTSQLYYQNHKSAVQERLKRYRLKLKADVIEAYGGKCSCCGEDHSDFLTVEHLNRDGKKHRSSVTNVYRDLRDRGYPKKGYTVLCFNCNIASAMFGSCPHQRPKFECT